MNRQWQVKNVHGAFRLPLRAYPDVLQSRLAEAKSGHLRFRVGDEPTLVWGTVW
ncbi:hypothetical protein P4S91_12330 [Aneurinibacillus aneurinilyticus]|uniref:Uncharacterized protein n=1 Tax=Aneurinibacillus aneurinilyticus TaxID=1391 RepID=A0A848CVS7_ANEAE|nr:hypothetical protein [Aneurinibacillus aneurinilyticus]MCI1694705.1 hypothetical protein [Aneurinibacillus aneurinilyticus]MED0706424.1 hypothetical protein [Aneurinibacillus aneurinilyticus]MED0723698.1 hypothetical protein [Aneurinibacillus aneurinilyticus]MED0741050.1 hypothetical protein [Aneurinibacillus aneurinilyticus]NME97456.1 hypothetical protein [Aneurinibacillus aneurinilyticus]